MKKHNKGAVLVEVLIALFITSLIFIGVYTTISISLVNTRYLREAKETSNFSSQLMESFIACSESEKSNMFDYIKANYSGVGVETEIDLQAVRNWLGLSDSSHYYELIDESEITKYKIQLFIIPQNSVYMVENSIGTPFGSGIYSPDSKLFTFELRVQRVASEWGGNTFTIYKERKPVQISRIFQINMGGG